MIGGQYLVTELCWVSALGRGIAEGASAVLAQVALIAFGGSAMPNDILAMPALRTVEDRCVRDHAQSLHQQ